VQFCLFNKFIYFIYSDLFSKSVVIARGGCVIAAIIATHSLPITTTNSTEMCDVMKSTIEQLHNEFSHDVRPPCKVLCYAVTAGFSLVKNDATCTHLQLSSFNLFVGLESFVLFFSW